MKKEELEAIKRRYGAATPGPWDCEDSRYIFAQVPGGRPNGEGIVQCGCYVHGVKTDEKADAKFIAAARTDVPNLVADVERLRVLLYHAWNFRNPNIAPLDTYEAHVKLRCDICKEIYEALGEE